MAKAKAKAKAKALTLSDVPPQIDETLTYQHKLRLAAVQAVTVEDLSEVTRGIVERAKQGDSRAIDDLFNRLLGGSQKIEVHATQINQAADTPLSERVYEIVQRLKRPSVSMIAAALEVDETAVRTVLRQHEGWYEFREDDRVSIAISQP